MRKLLLVLLHVLAVAIVVGGVLIQMPEDDITKISNSCSESQYNEVLPFKGVRFGMNLESVKEVLKDQIESVLEVNEHPSLSENMSVKLSDSPFEKVSFYFRYHSLVEVRLFYKRAWQLENGGHFDALSKVGRKFRRMFGFPDEERNALRWRDADELELNLATRGIEIYYSLFCGKLGSIFLNRYNKEMWEQDTKEFDYK